MGLLASVGIHGVAHRIVGTEVAAYTYVGLDKSDAAESASHTSLQSECTEAGLTRAAATITIQTTPDRIQWVCEFTNTSGATVGINAMGILNAASATANDLLFRHKYSACQNVLNNGSITVTGLLELAQS